MVRNMRDPTGWRLSTSSGQKGSVPRRESEEPIIPRKSVKADGGKGLWFWSTFEEGENREIGKPGNSANDSDSSEEAVSHGQDRRQGGVGYDDPSQLVSLPNARIPEVNPVRELDAAKSARPVR